MLRSRADLRSEIAQKNREANLASLAKLEKSLAKSREGGGEKYNARHVEAGKLLPRERVERLLDRDGWFLELAPLAGLDIQGHAPGASVVGGIGVVSGVECMITASEATVKGGAMSEYSVIKSGRLSDVAEQNGLPSISLIESAGADLPNQSKIFVPGGRGFRDLTKRSEERTPTVCLVFGSSTAGGAYIPGMSDYVVMVKKQAQVYLGGPPLVKMATGEETTHEELGGAEMHSRVSGVSDFLAEDEEDAIRIGREIVAHLNWKKGGPPPSSHVEEPLYSSEDLLGIASADVRIPFDAREVIARVVDGSRFSEFKPLYGPELVCGWAHVHGHPVGILANNGILFTSCANKGAQFIQLCNQSNVPLLYLQNIVGFMVGRKYEEEGIIKAGAKMINAVSNSTVPSITIMIGASYGAGNYAMAGRAYKPNFLFTWPNHRIAVMGGKQLAGVLDIIQREAAAKKGETVDEQRLGVMKQMTEGLIDQESDPFFATARVWDDGIIDPRDTRSVVGMCLSITHTKPVQGTTSWGVFRH
ncbi:Methylcrotonyl-CoA carboxylase carboxyl transferase subunit [Sandaracinus amylolyticus]|uniref:Methylcrotonyl-CoA carboxylase carboxyl transferase subunit n=1 Tax=Sandaracinus amylolyticus TaxID=927083 RepID=A0A0F6W0Z1_9BACT|nr:Methylcrotonyl-CoA carboxylase carboxyl transferase subunit [Sandaracinus amylolyticus]